MSTQEDAVEAVAEAIGWALCKDAKGGGPGKCDLMDCVCGPMGKAAARAAILACQKATADADMAWAVDAAKKIDPAAKSRPWLEWRLELARDEVIEECVQKIKAMRSFYDSAGRTIAINHTEALQVLRSLKSPAGEKK